jgi:hypothetical protein
MVMGILMMFHPMIFSGFSRIQTDLGDTRLVNYFLEHGYQHALGFFRSNFWSPSFFYPQSNVAAYSEVMIGVGPFYWILRLLGLPADTAFQVWMVEMSILNFILFAIFLKEVFKVKTISAAIGAFLFAFGAPRASQLMHQQMLPAFYVVILFWAAFKIFESKASPSKRKVWIALFFFSTVLQCYTGFYFAWFFSVSLAMFLFGVILKKDKREKIVGLLKKEKKFLLMCGFGSLVALSPFFNHYSAVKNEFGPRSFSEAKSMLLHFYVWIYRGADSWLYFWMNELPPIKYFLAMEHEKRIGIGLVTSMVVFLGLKENKKKYPIKILIYVFTVWFLCTLIIYKKSIWGILYPVIPGAGAARAISRIGVFFLFIYGIAVSLWVDKRKWSGWIVLVVVMCILEQGTTTVSFDKLEVRNRVEKIQSLVVQMSRVKTCEAFYYQPLDNTSRYYVHQIDAMWASIQSGVPTLNGYSGYEPKGWELAGNTDENMKLTNQDIERRIKSWVDLKKLDPNRICWIKSIG